MVLRSEEAVVESDEVAVGSEVKVSMMDVKGVEFDAVAEEMQVEVAGLHVDVMAAGQNS